MDDPDIDIPPYASPRLRSRGIDPETKRMAIIAGGLGIGIIVLALLWSGIHTSLGPPPVIKPPAGPMRTLPKNPGGLQVPGAHEQIMSGEVASGPPQLAPSSPQPDFSKLDQEEAAAQPKPATTTPASAPMSTTPALPLPPPPPPQLAAAAPPAPTPAPTPAPATPPATTTTPSAAPTSGPYAVQLAALTSMAKADEAWQVLVARVPDILGSQKPVVVPGVVHGTTFYRLRLDGFASAQAAGDFCARLKSRGVTCYLPK
jgi:cell division septation protein DedD